LPLRSTTRCSAKGTEEEEEMEKFASVLGSETDSSTTRIKQKLFLSFPELIARKRL
jgi:hypothetical protein